MTTDAFLEELSLEEFRAIRAESAEAKRNQQSILQWNIAAVAAIVVATIGLTGLAKSADSSSLYEAAFALLGFIVPFLAATGFGIWLGEVFRMERAGAYLRERERAIRHNSGALSAEDFGNPSIIWESLIYSDSTKHLFGKDRTGSLSSCALFFGTYYGGLALADRLLNSEPLQHLLVGPDSRVIIASLILITIALPSVFIVPLLRLLGASHGQIDNISVPSLPPFDLVIPCLNEVRAIAWISQRLPQGAVPILVDNGSSDASREEARFRNVPYVVEPHRGVGIATVRGIKMGSEEIVCVIDCDGTIDPAELGRLIDPLVNGAADYAIGTRVFDRHSGGLLHGFFIRVRAALVKAILGGVDVRDVGTARAFRRSSLSSINFDRLARGSGWSLDLTLNAIALLPPNRISRIPLRYRRRIGRSKISGSPLGSLRAIGSSILVALKNKRAIARGELGTAT